MPASTPLSRRPARWIGAALLLALIAGCTTPPGQVDRLLAHPEFPTAAQAAPGFTADALKTIADLEARK